MLSPTIIREIERLFQQGLSRRKIAKRLRVSLGIVSVVVAGKRQADDHLRPKPRTKETAKTRKCPSCHAIVHMPCKLCQTRELIAGNHLDPLPPTIDTPIGLNLKPEHEARYAQVRRWRREALRLGVVTKPQYDPDPP